MEELEGIVQRMIDAGEPEENIKLVIEEFTSREKNKEVDLGKPEAVQDAAPVTAEVEAVGTESILEDGLLDFPIEGSLSLDNELQPEYLINDKKVKRSDLNDKLYDSDFIEGIQDGKINVSVKNDPKIMDLLERQANSGSQWGDKIEAFNSGLATLASGITGVQSYIEDVITEITGLEPTGMALLQKGARDQVSEALAKKAEELSNQQRAYKDDFIGSISEGNILDAANIGFNTVANSAPIMVAAWLTGGAGGVVGSLTSAATMSGIMIPAEYASTKISEDEKIKELSDGDKLTRAFFRGGAEGVFEGLMGPVGSRSFSLFKDGVKNLVKTAAKESGADAAKEVAEGIGKKTALEVFKTFGISTAGEGGSEALTALSQDLTDDYLGIQNLSVEEYMRNAAEAGTLGIFMGGVTTGALGGAGQVMSYLPLRNQKVYQGAKTEVREKQESGEINNEEAKQMDDAIESAKVALDKTDPSLSEENQEKVAKLIDERERIKIEIEGLDDNQVPVQNKKNRIDEINKEISEIGIEKPPTEEETGVPPTPEELVSAETATAEVEKLRTEEQAEMLEQIPGAENALTDGKVNREKIATEEGKAKFDEIYSKYDEKISPLLETAPIEEATPSGIKEEIKLSDSELSTESVYNKNVEEDNEDFIKGSNEFKDKAVNYDEGINDPKFTEENTVKEEVDVNDIIPTQNKLFKKSLNNKSTESPILIKVGNKYYVEDGHHRIADKIMSGGGKLNATVYNSTPLETSPSEKKVESQPLEAISEKYPDVTIDVFEDKKNKTLNLGRIIVPEGSRGEGVGTRAMQDLVDYADSNNLKFTLTPSKEFGATSVTRLKKFYKQFGFVENKGRNRDFSHKESMYRVPELKEEIIKAMKPVKEKARSVASETTGLSPREAFKQGFTEFFDAIQRGKKEARQKAAENLKEKVNKLRESFKKKLQKEKDNKTARDAVVKEIRAIIKDSGLSTTSKRTINKIMTNVKNTNVNNMQRTVDEVMDVVNRDIDRNVRAARYKTLKAAIKKLSRLGALKELQNPLMGVLSINPDYLSKTALNFYDRVVINLANVEKKFDDRDSREDLKNDAEEVIKRFTNDNIRAEELAEKTINPNLDLTKTKGENLKQMLKDGLISDSDFELMTRFEDLIGSTTKEGLTLEELEQKAKERRDAAIEDFEAAMDEIPSSLPNLSRDDAEALRFANGLKMKDLESLSTAQIKMLTRGLEMLQAGFVTTNLVQSKIRVEAKREVTNTLISETEERGKIDSAISKAKVFVQNLFRKRDKMITSIENRIKSTPLTNIDQILNAGAKKFKSTRIYESIFRPVGAAFSRTEDFLNQVKKKLQVAESYLNLNGNKRYVQKAKVMIYQIQREFESNPKNNEVNEAVKWIKATLNDPKTNLSDVERKAIEKIRDEFTVNGQIDSKKLLDSLTDKEKKYMAIIDELYKSVEFMVAADAKMQGKSFVLRENYVHLPKVTKSKNSMSSDLEAISNSFTNPALKNKALTQRTGNAHAISFDPTFNVNGITKKAAISYYMYPAVKKAKITLEGVKQNAQTDFQKETADALESVFDGIVKSQYAHLAREKAFIEKALAFLGRAGYLAQLAGPVKAAVELGTNLTHALFVNPLGLISGFDTLSGNSREIMDAAINNLPTNQLNRLSGEGVKDSKEIDGRLINDSLNVFEQEEMTSEFRAKVNTIFKFAKKPASAIIKFNESLISRPDTIVARPLFVGVFNKSFENIAQEKPNWDKIANDQAYRDKFRDAINQATEDADTAVVDNAASNNPFDGIPKNVLDKDATAVKQALQMMDRYMTRFRTFEYYSALKGIQGLMGKGKLTPTQGAMLLAGTVARLSLYKMGIDMVFTLIFSMLGIDEEEDEIDLEKDLTKGVLGAVATLALGRSIGNIAQMPINFGTEWLNKEYGEGITRSGEYNQYKDGMVFSKIPQEVKPQDNMAEKILTSSLGSYTPVVKTVTRAGKLATRAATSEGEDTRERNFGELTTRIPFEIAGNLGIIPGYKTLRKIYLKYLFGGVEKSKKESEPTDTRRDTRRNTRRIDTRRNTRRAR